MILISFLMQCMWLSLMMVIEVMVIILQSAYHCVRIKGECGTGKNHFYIKLHVKIALGYTDYFSSECVVKKMKCFT